MCMATLIPANVDIPEVGLENGSITNDDGHGYAIASSKLGMETFKSMRFDETLASLKDARSRHGKGSVVLFHSRFGTHGEMGVFNVHPFKVGDSDTVVAHNGIMPSTYHPKDKDRRSDTRIFVDRIAGYFCGSDRGVPSRRESQTLGKMIGSGNKLVFLSVKSGRPAVRIVNRHLGKDDGGVWYSNDGYRWGGARYGRWWGDDDDWRSPRTATIGGVYTSRYPQERFSLEPCPYCGMEEVDEVANVCTACDFCLDCTEFLTNCMCYLPGSYSKDEGPEWPTLMDIQDIGDNGYVKVDGIWRWATSAVMEACQEGPDREPIALPAGASATP